MNEGRSIAPGREAVYATAEGLSIFGISECVEEIGSVFDIASGEEGSTL